MSSEEKYHSLDILFISESSQISHINLMLHDQISSSNAI